MLESSKSYFVTRPLSVKLEAFLFRRPEDPAVVADLCVSASNLSLVHSLQILKKSGHWILQKDLFTVTKESEIRSGIEKLSCENFQLQYFALILIGT